MRMSIVLPGVAALCFAAGFVLPGILQADARQPVNLEPVRHHLVETACRPAFALVESTQQLRVGYVEFE